MPLDYGGPCDEQVENGPHEGLQALVRALGRTTWRPAAGHGRCSTLHCVRSASEPQRRCMCLDPSYVKVWAGNVRRLPIKDAASRLQSAPSPISP
ncbi:hypothetical protein CPAR01_06318 [Colletotrichum paranaense]|uniref:Uncharacterized protein n=1 Tax=Colletotrichum paranaense TaxID=1914294 RepID=A0ABQ9SLF9_9PEZI|nr:uncharacterized protein CPAR01_06318 [Colletotrichum paranaense]KAK1540329.1 hypothetical protein CPAR01_06318 [Colletotrichum paranaense]